LFVTLAEYNYLYEENAELIYWKKLFATRNELNFLSLFMHEIW
jgi:hypothetical protein